MKKRAVLLLLTSLMFAAAALGCGQKNRQDLAEDDTNTAGTEENVDSVGTEAAMDTEDTSQLQLGSAVEIPIGFEDLSAETDAHPQLEQAIAEYCGVAEGDYANVRYYYNYVDLNDDGEEEILAYVSGKEAPGIDGSLLLWLDESDDEKITAHSIRQAFRPAGFPVYISNHMTDGYQDLLITQNRDIFGRSGTEEVNADNAGRTVDGEETSLDETAGLDETTGVNGAEMLSVEQAYLLLVWAGDKYQELDEGTAVSSLDGYEGTAVFTNNIESDIAGGQYHLLGEGMNESQ